MDQILLKATPRRRSSPTPRANRCAAAVMAAAAALFPGCMGGFQAGPVDAPQARQLLNTALEGWKNGDTPESLQKGSPPITVQDFDWMGGAKLEEFQVDGEGKNFDLNLHILVKLTLKTKEGETVVKTVTYIVGTSPRATVFRDFK
jgi:hypothetical protein